MFKNYKESMYTKSDDELIEMVSSENANYKEKELEAAEKELLRRGIHSENIDDKYNINSQNIDNEQKNILNSTSLFTRFLNYIIDFIAICILVIIGIILIGFFFSFIIDFNEIEESVLNIVSFVLFIFIYLMYFIILESISQKTIGKILTKSKVVNIYGGKPSLNEIILRSFSRLIPADNLSFLIKNSGFHDKISKTLVVKDCN